MNILIISYAFPPDMNSQAQHVYGLYRTKSKFANVDVLTSEKNNKIDDTYFRFNLFGIYQPFFLTAFFFLPTVNVPGSFFLFARIIIEIKKVKTIVMKAGKM